jgi:hypothetical protein
VTARTQAIEAAARAVCKASFDDRACEISVFFLIDNLRAALAMDEGAGRTLREQVNEPGFAALVAAKVAAMSVKCRCGREAHEHYWDAAPGKEEDDCPGFSADLDRIEAPPQDAPGEGG